MREPDDDSGLPSDVSGTVLTVGTFDGVHRGHQDVLDRLVRRARTTGLRSLLVTFDPHPLEVVNPAAAPSRLTVGAERLEVLAESGLDYVAVLPFTPALARYDAEAFVERILLDRFRMRELLMGHDHGFGRGRQGDVYMMQRLGGVHGFAVEVIPAVGLDDGHAISSTSIRRAVAGGDLKRAAEGLGRPYSISGRVVPGAGRGQSLGYRTLNVELPPGRKLLPPAGVYAVRAQTPSGPFGGMMNLGPRPTFDDHTVQMEAHLFDAAGDWYGASVRIDVIAWLREIRKFDGPAALIRQLADDERSARAALTLPHAPGTFQGSPKSS
jgi:riboflavin kinase/FMN adenylyltransferase